MNVRPTQVFRLGRWRTILVDAAIGAVAAEIGFQLRFNFREAPVWDLEPRARVALVLISAFMVMLSRALCRTSGSGATSGEQKSLRADFHESLARSGLVALAVGTALLFLGVVPEALAAAFFAATSGVLLLTAERLRAALTPCRDEVILVIAWSALALWWLWPLPSAWERSFGLLLRDSPLVVADSYLVTWILAWGAHVLATHPSRLFDAPIFFPVGSALGLSEHMLGVQTTFAPVWFATRNAVLATNMTVFVSYPLGALTAYLFARRFAGRPAAAIAGTIWAFHPYRYLQNDERHMLTTWCLPLALFFADRWLERARRNDAVGFACALVVQTLSSFYLAYATVLALVAFVPCALLRHDRRLDRRRLFGFVSASVVGFLPLAAVSLPYLRLRAEGILPVYGLEAVTSSLGMLFSPLRVAKWLQGEGLGPVSGLLVLSAFVPPWRHRFRELVIGIVLIATGVLVALGPNALPEPWTEFSPYRAFMLVLPGFSTMRIPFRMLVVAQLGVVVLSALGFERWSRDLHPGTRSALATAIVLAALATRTSTPDLQLSKETLWRDISPAIRWLSAHADDRALLELPGRFMESASQRMYYGTFHWLPLIEGYSGYMPRTPHAIHRMAQELPAEVALQELVDHVDVGWILVHLNRLPETQRAAWLAPLPPGLSVVGRFGDDLVVRVDRPVDDDRRALMRIGSTRSFGGTSLGKIEPPCRGSIRWIGSSTRFEGQAWNAVVEIENRSDSAWPGWAIDPRGEVAVRAELLNSQGEVFSTTNVALPRDVAPGERLRVPLSIGRTPAAGRWSLGLTLIQGVSGDLSTCGFERLSVPIHVWENPVT